MKKIISIALVAAAFGLVGCSAQDKPDANAYRDNTVSTANHKAKCKGKKCHSGKLGAEQSEQDVAK